MATTAAAADTPIVESSTSPETTIPLAVAEREVTAVLNEVVDVVEASEALVEDVVAGAGVADVVKIAEDVGKVVREAVEVVEVAKALVVQKKSLLGRLVAALLCSSSTPQN